MPADIVYLDSLRQGRSVPVAHRLPRPNPEETIRASADQWMVDVILAWAEEKMATTFREPLMPADRVMAMRMLAMIRPEPSQ
jgi:hypothetical protein